jgi:EAL domain-containing protein (putative c-di-GMP-specific phosphodiesterase class I)
MSRGDTDDERLVKAITGLGHTFGLKVLAAEAQRKFLRQEGCAEAQGYLFSRPLPSEEAIEFLKQRLGGPDRCLSPLAVG